MNRLQDKDRSILSWLVKAGIDAAEVEQKELERRAALDLPIVVGMMVNRTMYQDGPRYVKFLGHTDTSNDLN